jgi:hypothetical protein
MARIMVIIKAYRQCRTFIGFSFIDVPRHPMSVVDDRREKA